MEEIKEQETLWKKKVERAIETFSSIEDDIHNSMACLDDKIVKLEYKLVELSKAIDEFNKLDDKNESLFSPYKNTQKKAQEANLKEELDIVNNELPKLRDEITRLSKKREEYNIVHECLNLLHNIISNEISRRVSIDPSQSMENNYRNIVSERTEDGVKILEIQELERQRIARDLHDSTIQNLTNLMYKTELCIKLIDMDEIRARLELATLINYTKNIINDMREIIYNLRPMSIQDLGLVPTVERFINKYKEENKMQVIFNRNEEKKNLLPVINLTLYRIIQEAFNNIAKYANASICEIGLNYNESNIVLTIKDNGIGIQLDKVCKKESSDNSGFGLSIMKERALLLSGTFDIKSSKENGTEITVTIPYREQKEE